MFGRVNRIDPRSRALRRPEAAAQVMMRVVVAKKHPATAYLYGIRRVNGAWSSCVVVAGRNLRAIVRRLSGRMLTPSSTRGISGSLFLRLFLRRFRMRKFFAGVSVAAFVLALGAPAFAAPETIKGELVDQACYMKDAKNMGAAHKDCAVSCAQKGQTVALVTSDGKVYSVAGALAADKNAKLVAHMTHTVELTGEVTTADGKMTIAATDLKMAK